VAWPFHHRNQETLLRQLVPAHSILHSRRPRLLTAQLANICPTAPAHPPALPPTVEEAYRRKCIQLKERSKEIEDENDAYRLRLARLKRQIQKCRLERAFLLEQIAKRTSTNVEDSDGSPSPPPTVRHLRNYH